MNQAKDENSCTFLSIRLASSCIESRLFIIKGVWNWRGEAYQDLHSSIGVAFTKSLDHDGQSRDEKRPVWKG